MAVFFSTQFSLFFVVVTIFRRWWGWWPLRSQFFSSCCRAGNRCSLLWEYWPRRGEFRQFMFKIHSFTWLSRAQLCDNFGPSFWHCVRAGRPGPGRSSSNRLPFPNLPLNSWQTNWRQQIRLREELEVCCCILSSNKTHTHRQTESGDKWERERVWAIRKWARNEV